MSSHLGATKTLELLDRLQGTVRDFAAREEKANREFLARCAADRRLRERAIAEVNRWLEAVQADAESALQTAKQAAESKYQRRTSRIVEAHKASKKQAADYAANWEGTRKYRLQKEEMQSARDRETGLAATEEAYEEFKRQLAEEEARLLLLEHTARDSFSGYGSFLRELSRAHELTAQDLAIGEHQLLAELSDLLTRSREELTRFGEFFLPRFFGLRWVWLLLVLCLIPQIGRAHV